MLRVILTTGGTGGHVFPALAVAEELKKQVPDVEILFMGGRYGLEQHWVRDAGLEFVGLPVQGIMGKGLRSISAIVAIALSITEAWNIIREFKPHVVTGFGGYASFAGVLSAILHGCPTVIHEQNAVPGAANKILGKFVSKICLTVPDTNQKFPAKKTVITGNPVRREIVNLPKKIFSTQKRNLLIMGGSQGANSINNAVIEHLQEFKEAGLNIWHQTGKTDYVTVREAYITAGIPNAKVVPFVDDMAAAYSWADLAVCRSGASTVAELAMSGTPSILVPFPSATHNHQQHNAEYLAEGGAAIIVEDKALMKDSFAKIVTGIINEKEQLESMHQAALALKTEDAAAKIAETMRQAISPKARQDNWK